MIRVLRRLASPLRPDRRGVTSVEFALVAVPLTLLLFGVVEIGLVVRMKSALQYATTQAARCAVVNATLCGTTDKAQSYAITQTMGVAVAKSAFIITTEPCGRKVSASVAFPIVAHRVIPSALTLSAYACYPV